jgi:hypothetical protein
LAITAILCVAHMCVCAENCAVSTRICWTDLPCLRSMEAIKSRTVAPRVREQGSGTTELLSRTIRHRFTLLPLDGVSTGDVDS